MYHIYIMALKGLAKHISSTTPEPTVVWIETFSVRPYRGGRIRKYDHYGVELRPGTSERFEAG